MFVNESGRNEQPLQRTFHRCFLSSFDSFGLAVSEEKIFLNRPIRNKNWLWQPCLLMDRDEMSKLYKVPSIDASYQVSVHLAKGFQRRRLKCEKLMDAKWWQKLILPLARWAKNIIQYLLYTVISYEKLFCQKPQKFDNILIIIIFRAWEEEKLNSACSSYN